MVPLVYLFCDGSCGTATESYGTWAAYAATSTERKIMFGSAYPTTISRMELIPIIEGLVWIRKNWGKYVRTLPLRVYSDSEYTIKTLSGMYEPHKNMDLWNGIAEASKGFEIEFIWYQRNVLPAMELCDSTVTAVRTTVMDMADKLFGDHKKPEALLPWMPLP